MTLLIAVLQKFDRPSMTLSHGWGGITQSAAGFHFFKTTQGFMPTLEPGLVPVDHGTQIDKPFTFIYKAS